MNDIEPTQRGRGLFTEGSSRREIGVVSTTFIYTENDTSRVCIDKTDESYDVGILVLRVQMVRWTARLKSLRGLWASVGSSGIRPIGFRGAL